MGFISHSTEMTLLKLSYSSVGFFLQNNLFQTNQSMFPYISIPFVLYITPQYNNPKVHTLKESKKVANRTAAYHPKRAIDTQFRLLSFLHCGSQGTEFPIFSQHQILKKFIETIISKIPTSLSKHTQNWPRGQKLTKNRAYDLSHCLRQGDQKKSRSYSIHFNSLESCKCNVNENRPGKEKHYTKVTSLQAQVQLASSSLLCIKLNAGLVNMQLSLTGGL